MILFLVIVETLKKDFINHVTSQGHQMYNNPISRVITYYKLGIVNINCFRNPFQPTHIIFYNLIADIQNYTNIFIANIIDPLN